MVNDNNETPSVEIDTNIKGVFKFENGDRLQIDPGLFVASEVVRNAAKSGTDFEVPVDSEIDLPELELMNDFIKLMRENFESKLKTDGMRKDIWFDFIPQNIAVLEPLAKKADKDLLIGAANAADLLEAPCFLSFCAFFLVTRTKDLNLSDLREFLNETNDFSEEQRRVIAECPELTGL